MKKTIYTLATPGYAPELMKVTLRLMERYAEKIEADFIIMGNERKFPDKYVTYEKFQIWDLMHKREDEWSIFFDSDTMIHPDMFDVTAVLPKDTTCSGYSSDFTPLRFRPDYAWLRDGRYLGKGTWFIVCSDLTRDIWHPLDDISYEYAVAAMFPINDETVKIKKTPESLIDDYLVSRNIARYGLKHTLLTDICQQYKIPVGTTQQITGPQGQQGTQVSPYLQHDYNRDTNGKIVWAEKVLQVWGVTL